MSICIPAYKRIDFLKRLLHSITIQTFRDFEVVVTDDSPDDGVAQVCNEYKNKFVLRYFKNPVALGTPENWNQAIRHAKGEWIKIMHDDDWFVSEASLDVFAKAAAGRKFLFSAYRNVFDGTGSSEDVHLPFGWKNRLEKNPMVLFAHNVIGPPSVTLVHRSITAPYDNRMKWRVDIDFYIRVLQSQGFSYIDQPLINVGISDSQVTQISFNRPDVELPESLLMLTKYGTPTLNYIRVYDGWWRMLRNLNIRREADLKRFVPDGWPVVILKMVQDQSKIKQRWLHYGVLSKLAMGASYLKNRKYLRLSG